MKLAIYISFFMLSSFSFSQQWRDSLAAAKDAYSKQEYSKALELYKSAQKNAPEEIDLSKEIGQSAYRNLQYKDAEEIYRQQVSTEKTAQEKAKTYHNLGNSLMQQKKYDQAIEAYKQSLRNDYSSDKTRHNLAEAIRLKQEQQKQKEQNKEDKQNNQDENKEQNSNNQQQDKDDKKEQQSKDNQQNKNDQQNKSNSSNQQNTDSNESKLQDKAVEKKLDELMKQDAATKRKMGGSKTSSGSSKSGKDW